MGDLHLRLVWKQEELQGEMMTVEVEYTRGIKLVSGHGVYLPTDSPIWGYSPEELKGILDQARNSFEFVDDLEVLERFEVQSSTADIRNSRLVYESNFRVRRALERLKTNPFLTDQEKEKYSAIYWTMRLCDGP